jgi:sporulation protein YlmC with PRC-barrel domain
MIMTRSLLFTAGAAWLAASALSPAFSQGVEQMISVPAEQQQSSGAGYRTSMVVGRDVVDEHNMPIGKVDDLIVTANGKVPYAVLSVGGFLGIDSKYVIVPFTSIEIQDNRMMFRGATKEALENLPAFKYRT